MEENCMYYVQMRRKGAGSDNFIHDRDRHVEKKIPMGPPNVVIIEFFQNVGIFPSWSTYGPRGINDRFKYCWFKNVVHSLHFLVLRRFEYGEYGHMTYSEYRPLIPSISGPGKHISSAPWGLTRRLLNWKRHSVNCAGMWKDYQKSKDMERSRWF